MMVTMSCPLEPGSKYVGATLVFLPTERSDKRSHRSRNGVGSLVLGSSVWADVARHTTTGKFREGELGEVDSRALTSTVAAVFVDPLVVQSEELQRIDKGRKTSI
jgi:hypothetical protein